MRFLTALAALTLPLPALASVLVYEGDNRWVTVENNKPQVDLAIAARNGAQHFTAVLPAEDRELSLARLVVLKGIIERFADTTILIEEIVGETPSNTLTVEIKAAD